MDSVLFWVVLILLAILLYLLPTFIAFNRVHRNRWVIMIINVVFGATVLGWLIALVWALNRVDSPKKGGKKYDPQPHDPSI